ncbi:MAG: hypothetical protein U0522_00440 [Candidatus Paceibacterota bacterium]
MKKIIYFLLLFLSIPNLALAHVKWFVDTDAVTEKYHETTTFYSWGSKEVIIWSLIILAVVFLFSLIDRYIKTPKKLLAFGLKHERAINRVAQIVLGVFLITVSFIWKVIIIPEIQVTDVVTTVLQFLQAFVGVMFVLNIRPQIASFLLFLFCVGMGVSQGFVAILENAILVSLSLYFFIVFAKEDSKVFRLFHKHAVEIVRIGTGISLITLTFTEKFLYPELSLQFLSVYHWNFMQMIFPWFTDKLFVLSTGFAEMIFGILFILGYLTRITTISIAIFFALSVVTMFTQFGHWEVEDLQVYSAAILFIFYGHGRTKFFYLLWPNSRLQKSIFSK